MSRERCEVCAPNGCTCVSPSQLRELASIINPAAERECEQLRAENDKLRELVAQVRMVLSSPGLDGDDAADAAFNLIDQSGLLDGKDCQS